MCPKSVHLEICISDIQFSDIYFTMSVKIDSSDLRQWYLNLTVIYYYKHYLCYTNALG